MNNLKEPYGECVDDLKLHYYPTYTQSACTIDCMERYLDMKCRCRLLYMPKNPFQGRLCDFSIHRGIRFKAKCLYRVCVLLQITLMSAPWNALSAVCQKQWVSSD